MLNFLSKLSNHLLSKWEWGKIEPGIFIKRTTRDSWELMIDGVRVSIYAELQHNPKIGYYYLSSFKGIQVINQNLLSADQELTLRQSAKQYFIDYMEARESQLIFDTNAEDLKEF